MNARRANFWKADRVQPYRRAFRLFEEAGFPDRGRAEKPFGSEAPKSVQVDEVCEHRAHIRRYPMPRSPIVNLIPDISTASRGS